VSAYPLVAGPDPLDTPALGALLDELRRRHRGAICGALLYGSCLRSGNIFDGLLDLYLICDDYGSAYEKRRLALANWLLPPNVFYVELEQGEQVLRSKVTVISLADFRRGCSRAWFQSYIWGRFAQPTRIVYSRDDTTREELEECLLQAAHTLLERAVPSAPPQGSVGGLWEQALGMSYATELRTERGGRAAELVAGAADFYAAVTRHWADSLAFPFAVYDADGECMYRSRVPAVTRRLSAALWLLRRLQGKLLSILRLVKALFTFEGGLDYIAWKLERHSGEKIVIPDRVRRAPLLFMWGFFWGLYRRGVFK
jgi:hypothetical protein